VAICEQAPKVLGRLLGCRLAPKPVKGKNKQAAPEKQAAEQPTAEQADESK
jgi:hypothetical protein